MDRLVNDNFDADRIMNPESYDERHFSNSWLQSHPVIVQGSTNSGHSVLCQPTADDNDCSTEGDEDINED